MSIDINWETITSGPDGDALAERIRSFIDDKFQQVSLPRFIRSVKVHSFDFGKTGPDLEIKDICNPLPDFYEDVSSDDEEYGEGENDIDGSESERGTDELGDDTTPDIETSHRQSENTSYQDGRTIRRPLPPGINTRPTVLRQPLGFSDYPNSPFLARNGAGTPGIPGGTSNLSYFHLPLSNLQGSQTPLAAVAGGSTPFASTSWAESARPGQIPQTNLNLNPQRPNQLPRTASALRHAEEPDASRPSTANSAPSSASLKPSSGSSLGPDGGAPTEIGTISTTQHSGSTRAEDPDTSHLPLESTASPSEHPHRRRPHREKRVEDLQVITRVRYAGDIRLSLTADILLDYPMPSFAALPLKLNITGLTFDGVAVVAYIRRRAHFCFLSKEDGAAYEVSGDKDATDSDARPSSSSNHAQHLGLLEEIRVESEIGRKESGKQVLKNVGKVEKFVLEQVRRIFEDEFVYPSFWTFLV